MTIPTSLPITLDNFQQVVVEESKNKLVMIAFWAEQIPESIELKMKLEKATKNCIDHVLMTSVDCQAEQQIVQQFGLQNLPTVILIKDGQPIDGVSGPQTDDSLIEFLDKHLPKKQDTLLIIAKEALLNGDASTAYNSALEAHQLDKESAEIKIILAEACLILGKIDETQALIETITMVDHNSEYHSLIAKLELAKAAANSPELIALEQAVKSDPTNAELIQKLAIQYNQVNRNDDALNLLFRQVQTQRDDVKSKELLLDIMKALPEGDALAKKYQRKLYTLMY